MKRIHANQVEAIANALNAILIKKKRASRTLERTIEEHPKWGSRDRNLLYQATYNILRWKRKFNHLASIEDNAFSPWALIKCWCILNDYKIPDWKEMDTPPYEDKQELQSIELDSKAIEYSYPDWLFDRIFKELKDEAISEIQALNKQAGIALRVNRLIANPKRLKIDLQRTNNIDTNLSKTAPDALLLPKGRKLNKNPYFLKGQFEIQDLNSQRIAPFCRVSPGMRVVDLCAGAGGKTLHLASLMRNQGEIKAFDVSLNKLRELKRRAKRGKATIIETAVIDQFFPKESLKQWADIVLIDAPCSGLGTLKRNPEIKWNIAPERLKELQQIQRKLLHDATLFIKSGGSLIYATCSILPSENQQQIEWFLSQESDYTLQAMETISARESSFDGFFMARMKKK